MMCKSIILIRNEAMRECWKFDSELLPSWEDLKQALNDKQKDYGESNAYEQIHFG